MRICGVLWSVRVVPAERCGGGYICGCYDVRDKGGLNCLHPFREDVRGGLAWHYANSQQQKSVRLIRAASTEDLDVYDDRGT